MDTTIIASLIGIVGGLIGAWIGGIISRKASLEAVESSNRNAADLMQRQEFNKAAAEFRASFIEEQRLIDLNSAADKTNSGSASHIVKEAINKHEVAMMRFEPFVSKDRLEAYKQAWHEYADNYKDPNKYSGNTLDKQKEGRKIALANISELLEFAKPKH